MVRIQELIISSIITKDTIIQIKNCRKSKTGNKSCMLRRIKVAVYLRLPVIDCHPMPGVLLPHRQYSQDRCWIHHNNDRDMMLNEEECVT